MTRTKVIINYLSPLLALEDPQLELFVTKWVSTAWGDAKGRRLYVVWTVATSLPSTGLSYLIRTLTSAGQTVRTTSASVG